MCQCFLENMPKILDMIFDKICQFLFETIWENSGSWCRSYFQKKICFVIFNNDFYIFFHKNLCLKLRKFFFFFFGYKIYIRSLNFPTWSQTKNSKFFQKSCPGTWACSPQNMGIYTKFLDIVPRSVKCTYCFLYENLPFVWNC